jgi:hypothetical protein
MKTFKVGFSYTVYGVATHIEAESAEEAEAWLFEELSQNGLDEVDYSMQDRDYTTQDAEEAE